MQERELKARDLHAEGYEEQWRQIPGVWFDWIEIQAIMNRLDPQMQEVVLEAGCGTGRLTRRIALRCKKVHALDFSPVSIKVLNKRTREEGINNVQSLVWDITRPYPLEERVDKIVSCGVVQHLPTEHHRHLALQNMYDQLRDDGTLVITFYNWQAFAKPRKLKESEGPEGIHLFQFSRDEAETALRNCGFQEILLRAYNSFRIYKYPRMRDPRFSRILHIIAQSDLYLSKFNISPYFGEYLICKAQK